MVGVELLSMIQKPIKVIHYRSIFLGLTENWIYNQINNLHTVEVIVYCYYRKNKEVFPFEDIRTVKKNKHNIPPFINKMWNKHAHWSPHYIYWLLRDNPNVIHAHFGTSGYHMLPYSRLLEIPLITSFYGYDAYKVIKQDPKWISNYKKLFKHGRLFLVEGPAMRKKLIELGCPSEKITIHSIGVKIEDYEFHQRKFNKDIRLMVCGRFVEKKGIPYAIEVLSKVRSKVNNKVTMTIVGDSDGKGSLTKEKKKIINVVRKYKLSKSVKFTDFIDHSELIKIAYNHHILLSPSVHAVNGDAEGGFPVILTEMLATGMPVVAFSHCDIPYIIKDGKNGFLAPEKNVDILAEKLEYLIKHPKLLMEMGKFGRKLVEEQYDIKKLNSKLEKLYFKLANS